MAKSVLIVAKSLFDTLLKASILAVQTSPVA